MYKFTDVSESEVAGGGGTMKKGGGCYVSATTGVIIALLAIAISVGVGMIVHFAENRTLECTFPDGRNKDGSVVQAQTGDKATITTPCPTLAEMTSSSTPSTSEKTPVTLTDIRLPKAWTPLHYTLKITPRMYGDDPAKFTFEGHVKIEMNCTEATQNVTLHINQLNISSPRFGSTSDSSSPNYVSHSEDKDRQFLIIHLDKSAMARRFYFLEMEFTGHLKDDMKGLYLTSFQQGDKTSYAAVTQFQPTDARKAFPCFDEPQLKATFDITLVRKNHLKSISNMPISNSIPVGNDMEEDHFERTRKMSTYLLAFVIGDFEYTAANTSKGLLYRAWATPDSVDQTRTALDVGVQTIVNYEKYFGIDFPLPKQDMIAVPELSFGAMENWGLITYKEKYMLYTHGVSPESSLEDTTLTITHELAHMWFGDLVTMRWWDDLWLNEGFARFVEHLGADFIHPDWKMFEEFIVYVLQGALEFDGLVSSHPIHVPVNNPDEIAEIFDTISYSKGASVIRMMRFVLGEETFQKGIQLYLNRHRYQNAFHDDLWQALTEQSTNDGRVVNVKDFMNTWILQMNYPVVKVEIQNDRILLRQSRFLGDPDAVETGKYTSPFGYKWQIPFTYTTSDNLEFNTNNISIHWLYGDTIEIGHPGVQNEGWVLGNVQQYGFYRVTYEDENWLALVAQLKSNHKVIHTINRAQIINDAWSLSRARQLSTTIALGTLEYLSKEVEFIPWVAAQRQIYYLDRMLGKTDLYGHFQTFMRATLTNPLKHFGMDDSNSSHIETIDPDLRDTVYCTALSEGGSEEWDFLYNQFKATTVPSEKSIIMQALACTKSTWLLSRYLSLSISPTEIRKQDAVDVIVYVSQNPVGQTLTWDFVRANWDVLMNEYGNGLIALSKLISGITESFNTEFQLTQLKDFLAKHPYMGTGARAFQQAIEKTQSNIKWMQHNKAVISNWLQTVNQPKVRVTDVRLPRHLIPRTYDLTIQPNMYGTDPDNFYFEGYVKIIMEATDAGSNVTLNANKLTIDEHTIQFGRQGGVAGGPVYTGDRRYDSNRQFEIFSLDKDVTVGEKYFIEMNFTGPLTGDLTGLYLGRYKRGNETVYMATTQLESTDARKAFPCFDEPDFKAEFNVKLVRKDHLKSLSNMPIIGNKSLSDDFTVDIFATTPNMSTYLLCLIVCDFDYTEAVTTKGVQYRAWARPESVNQTQLALDEGVKIVDYYADYFGIDFPLPKMDMFALPDFRGGAMENWALITYRESAMLIEDDVASETNLQYLAGIIEHELAHMWFGDLVTMDWWDDLWLNEGFATFVSYMGVDHIYPDWKMFEQIIFDLYNKVFVEDALVTSHPIYIPVYNPIEIGQIFDAISYEKGSMVIRMMRFFLSEEVFQQGVQIYLRNREYSNANHNDLWDGLEQAAKKAGISIDVRGILDTWILQMNYPVVMVSKSASGKIMLQQKRFLSNPNAEDPGKYHSPYNYTWQIPFTFTTKIGADFNVSRENIHWFVERAQELGVKYPSPGNWILGNIQQFGIYRVNYEEDNWLELIKQLKSDHKVIHTINRGQIINDGFELAKAGELPMSIALRTVDYLQHEDDYIPWVAASGQLEYIATMLLDSEVYCRFQDFMSATTETQFERLGLNNTGSDHLTSLLRSLIAHKACNYGNEKCITEAKTMFEEYTRTKINSIAPGVRDVVYCTSARTGGETEWAFLFGEYKHATAVVEKMRLMAALSCTRQPWLLKRMLDLTFQEDVIRKQDAYLVYRAVGSNEFGTLIAWNFMRDNWDRIVKEFGGSSLIGRIITGVTSSFSSEFLLKEMKDFEAEHPDMGRGASAYSHAIESVEDNVLWLKKHYLTVKEWLDKMHF